MSSWLCPAVTGLSGWYSSQQGFTQLEFSIEAAEKRKSECLRIELMLSKSIIFSTGVMVLVIIITIMMNVTESKALHFIYVCQIVYCGNNQLQSSVLYFQVFLLNFANTCTMQSQMLTYV